VLFLWLLLGDEVGVKKIEDVDVAGDSTSVPLPVPKAAESDLEALPRSELEGPRADVGVIVFGGDGGCNSMGGSSGRGGGGSSELTLGLTLLLFEGVFISSMTSSSSFSLAACLTLAWKMLKSKSRLRLPAPIDGLLLPSSDVRPLCTLAFETDDDVEGGMTELVWLEFETMRLPDVDLF